MQSFTRFLALAAAAVPFLAQAAPVTQRAADDLTGKYIVQLKADTDVNSIASHHNKVRQIHARNLARRNTEDVSTGIEREFHLGDFKGYSGSFDDATVEELKALPEVTCFVSCYFVLLLLTFNLGSCSRARLPHDY